MKERIVKYRFIIIIFLSGTACLITAYITTLSTRNVEWSYSNGVILISGTGNMHNYAASEGSFPPWYGIREDIEKVIIEDEITRIGMNSFIFCKNLKEVYVGKNIQEICCGAFFYCKSLSKMIFKEKIPSKIDATAFKYDNEIEFIVE